MRAESDFIAYRATEKLAGRSVLALAPHPDDEVFGCGGALAKHLQAGDSVSVIIVTDGAFDQPDDIRSAHIALREAESIAASKLIGYAKLSFLRYRDRELQNSADLVGNLTAILHSMEVDLVYVSSIDEMHPDHLALAYATLHAVASCSRDVSVAMYEVGRPLRYVSHLVDISDVFPIKSDAMRCFRSQLSNQSYDRHIVALNAFRTYTLGKDVLYAEAFWVVDKHALGDLIAKIPEEFLLSNHDFGNSVGKPAHGNLDQEAKIAELENQLQRIYRSNTWRVMASLRGLRRVVEQAVHRIIGA